MKKIIYFLIGLFLFSCSQDETNNATNLEEKNIEIPNIPNKWTYISLSQGTTIGSCELDDTLTQKEFYKRTDWDIAICNGIIRTNSGTSGIGKGGITTTETTFQNVDIFMTTLYNMDKDTVHLFKE